MKKIVALLAVSFAPLGALASYDTPSLIEFDTQSYVVNESQTNLVVTFVRTGDYRQAASFDYQLEEGTAEAGSDFSAGGGRVNFKAGEGFKVLNIPIAWDAETEQAETFSIVLTNAGYNTQLVHERADVTIQDSAAAVAAETKLSIRPDSAGLLISWPMAASEATLERSVNPTAEVWEIVASAPKQIGSEWAVTQPTNGPRYFYRLREEAGN